MTSLFRLESTATGSIVIDLTVRQRLLQFVHARVGDFAVFEPEPLQLGQSLKMFGPTSVISVKSRLSDCRLLSPSRCTIPAIVILVQLSSSPCSLVSPMRCTSPGSVTLSPQKLPHRSRKRREMLYIPRILEVSNARVMSRAVTLGYSRDSFYRSQEL